MSKVVFVECKLQQIKMAGIAVENPYAESRQIVPILVPHIDVCVLETGALLWILDALQLCDERRLARGIVAEYEKILIRG